MAKPKPIKVGVNYPAFNYGWDFGQPPTLAKTRKPADLPSWYDKKGGSHPVLPLLNCLKQMGVQAVRWFIFGDGWTYDLPTPLYDDPKKVFDPPPIGKVKDFERHFVMLLEAFAKAKLQLMPVLLDFHMFLPAERVNVGKENEIVNLKQGRAVIATDDKKRDYFVENTVKPLLGLCSKNKETILAWDVMNEPELAQVDKGKLQPLLVACLEAVKAAGMQRTIGWQKRTSAQDWPDASALVTMPQFHYYPESIKNEPLKSARFTNTRILGEIATETQGSPKWKDLANKGKDTVEQRIRTAQEQGYEWVFLWSVNGASNKKDGVDPDTGKSLQPDERTRWDDTTRQSLVAYTKKQACAPQGHNIGDLAR